MLGTLLDLLGAAALVVGLLLATIGLYGMLRKPAIFDQLHAAGMVTGPSLVLVLVASIATRDAEIITSAVLVILFVLITSPLSGHAIAQAAWRRDRDSEELAERMTSEPDASDRTAERS